MCLLPAAKRSVDGITALFCFLASERSHSWVESDCGMWPIWATCLKYGICFSDGFLGVTHPSMRVDPVDLKEVCVTALADPKSALNCLTSLSRNEVSLVLIWSHQAVPILLRNPLGQCSVLSGPWGICHFVLHILVVWGHKAGRTNVSHHRPGLPPRSSRWQP